jgi:hypothetical protein
VFATTGSNQFDGSQVITGSLTVTGEVVAQTLNVQEVTSSIVFSSGSNIFGNDLGNTQQLTGSVSITGSLTVNNTPAVLGSLTSGQVVFGTAANTVGGDSGLFWDNANKHLGVGTNIPQQKIHAQGTDATTIIAERTGVNSGIVGLYASQNPAIIWGESTDFLRFAQIDNTALGGFIERWRIGSTGILQSNGAQTIQTSTGNLTIATAGGNGNILLTPNGTGNVGIGTTSPGGILNVAGSNAAHETTGIPTIPTLLLNRGTSSSLNYAGLVITTNAASSNFGLYSNQNGALFYHGGTERMRITSGGNVLIGTTTDLGYKLTVAANTGRSTLGIISVEDQPTDLWMGANNGTRWSLTTRGSSEGYNLSFFADGGNGHSVRIKHSNGNVGIGTTDPAAKLHAYQSGTSGVQTIVAVLGSDSTRPVLQFSESTTGTIDSGMSIEYDGQGSGDANKMYINNVNGSPVFTVMSGGGVGIGTVSPSFLLTLSLPSGVNGEIIRMNRSAGAYGWSLGIDSSTSNFNFYNNGSTSVANINNSTGAYTATSDQRLKENILDSNNALEKVLQIKVRKYDWKDTEIKEDFGFIAQELFGVLPQYVHQGDENTNWGVAKAELVPVLVKAIQEQQTQIESLKAEIQTLKQ